MNNLWDNLAKKATEIGEQIGKLTSGLGKQLGRATEEITKKTEEVVAIQKLKNEIRTLENENAHNCIDLGEIVYGMYEDGESISEEMLAICKQLEERIEKIESLEEELAQVKGTINCELCQAEIEYASIFCHQCGEQVSYKQETEEEEEGPEFEVEFTYADDVVSDETTKEER